MFCSISSTNLIVSSHKSSENFNIYLWIIFSGNSSLITSSFSNLKFGITIGLLEKIPSSVIGNKTVFIVVILIIFPLNSQNFIISQILYFSKIIILQTKDAIKCAFIANK